MATGLPRLQLIPMGWIRSSAGIGSHGEFPRDGGHRRARRGCRSADQRGSGRAGRIAIGAITPDRNDASAAWVGLSRIILRLQAENAIAAWKQWVSRARLRPPRLRVNARARPVTSQRARDVRVRMQSRDLIPATGQTTRSSRRQCDPPISTRAFTPVRHFRREFIARTRDACQPTRIQAGRRLTHPRRLLRNPFPYQRTIAGTTVQVVAPVQVKLTIAPLDRRSRASSTEYREVMRLVDRTVIRWTHRGWSDLSKDVARGMVKFADFSESLRILLNPGPVHSRMPKIISLFSLPIHPLPPSPSLSFPYILITPTFLPYQTLHH